MRCASSRARQTCWPPIWISTATATAKLMHNRENPHWYPVRVLSVWVSQRRPAVRTAEAEFDLSGTSILLCRSLPSTRHGRSFGATEGRKFGRRVPRRRRIAWIATGIGADSSAPHKSISSARSVAGLRVLRLVARKVVDPVDLPGLATVGREGLLKVGVGGRDALPLQAHKDHASVPRFHVIEFDEARAAALTDGGRKT